MHAIHPIMKVTTLALMLATVLASGGCAMLASRPTPQTFLLVPGKPPVVKTSKGSVSVSFVDVSAQFGAGNFQYRLSDADWETDPYNRFLSSPQEMMTSILRTWLGDSRQFSAVLLPGEGGAANLRVDTEVAELYIDFRNPDFPQAVVTMEIAVHRLVDSGVQSELLKRTFTARTPVVARTPEAFVAAWEGALRQNLLSLTAALH